MSKKYEAELAGVCLKEDVFEFDIYEEGTDSVLATIDVKDRVAYHNHLEHSYDPWTKEVREKAGSIAVEKGYFALAEYAYAERLREEESVKNILATTSFEELNQLVPCREDLTVAEEKAYIQKCYSLYKEEGFADAFRSRFAMRGDYYESPFKVLHAISVDEEGYDLKELPLWKIEFPDGATTTACPEEVILFEQLC